VEEVSEELDEEREREKTNLGLRWKSFEAPTNGFEHERETTSRVEW
jgi:hypothetical protein